MLMEDEGIVIAGLLVGIQCLLFLLLCFPLHV